MIIKNSARFLYLICGWISFILGLIGAFVPLLPTTPFLLLAAFFFSRGSAKLHRWILNLPTLGQKIKDWEDYGVIDKKSKTLAMAALIFVVYSIWFHLQIKTTYKTMAITTIIGVMVFILSRPSKRSSKE